MSYPAKNMNKKGMTVVPVAAWPVSAKDPESAVTKV
jgi:hypothetical protein